MQLVHENDVSFAVMEKGSAERCSFCGNVNEKVYYCAECKKAEIDTFYCGKECQTAHWRVHRYQCKKLAPLDLSPFTNCLICWQDLPTRNKRLARLDCGHEVHQSCMFIHQYNQLHQRTIPHYPDSLMIACPICGIPVRSQWKILPSES